MIKKYPVLLTIMHLVFFGLYGQAYSGYRNQDYDIHKFSRVKIKTLSPQNHITINNIGLVTVIDARPDTIPIGFMQNHVINRSFIELDKSVRQETEEFVNHYLQLTMNDSSGTLLMVLKKLWLSDELNIYEGEHPHDKVANFKKEYISGIKIKVEFYLKKQDDYYPLYRYDSLITDSINIDKYGSNYFYDAIIASLSKLIHIADRLGNIGNKRKISLAEIRQQNEAYFEIPILKDTSLRRGVYSSFEEFKNNNPSQSDFEVKNDKINDMLYIRQPDGKEYVLRDCWGYCDGHKTFIRSADNFFELQREGNAYYIYGSKNLVNKYNEFSRLEPMLLSGINPSTVTIMATPAKRPPTPFNRKHIKLMLEPLELDWDTGKLD